MNINIVSFEGKDCPKKIADVIQRMGDPGPPIDDTVCVPKPPTTGNWQLNSVDGVIATPYTWVAS